MKWLVAIFKSFSIKVILSAFIDYLKVLAAKTDTQIDDDAVHLIEIIFKEANLI